MQPKASPSAAAFSVDEHEGEQVVGLTLGWNDGQPPARGVGGCEYIDTAADRPGPDQAANIAMVGLDANLGEAAGSPTRYGERPVAPGQEQLALEIESDRSEAPAVDKPAVGVLPRDVESQENDRGIIVEQPAGLGGLRREGWTGQAAGDCAAAVAALDAHPLGSGDRRAVHQHSAACTELHSAPTEVAECHRCSALDGGDRQGTGQKAALPRTNGARLAIVIAARYLHSGHRSARLAL